MTKSQDPKKFPTLASSAPEEFRVKDLLGQVQMKPYVSIFCRLCYLPQFDPKYFSTEYPLHKDFIPDAIARRNFQIFIAMTVLVTSLFMILPLWLIFFTVGRLFHGTITTSELPLALVGLFLLSVPFWLYYGSKVETAWKRYASFVYSNAEPKTVFARSTAGFRNAGTPIRLSYPNGFHETVYVRFYNYDYSIIRKLFNEKAVSMRRDRTSNPVAVILEIDGDRIWCASLPSD